MTPARAFGDSLELPKAPCPLISLAFSRKTGSRCFAARSSGVSDAERILLDLGAVSAMLTLVAVAGLVAAISLST
jgi:hypothetical protein